MQPKTESTYTEEIANAPTDWMEEQVESDHGLICDEQSAYLNRNPCYSYFVYPDLMKNTLPVCKSIKSLVIYYAL